MTRCLRVGNPAFQRQRMTYSGTAKSSHATAHRPARKGQDARFVPVTALMQAPIMRRAISRAVSFRT